MITMEPYRLTATEAAKKIRNGELTVVEYAKSLLSRIEQRDPIVKAWAYLNPEHVLEEAKRLDAVPLAERGPLHGVGIAVKDVIYTKGEYKIMKFTRNFTESRRHAHSAQLNHL